MTVSQSEPVPGPSRAQQEADLARRIEEVLHRRKRDLAVDELEALEMALAVPCAAPPRGCNARAGVECSNLADGGPLVRQLFHLARGKAAGVEWVPTTPAELAGNPKRISETARQQRIEQERAAQAGLQDGKGWGRSAAAADQGWH